MFKSLKDMRRRVVETVLENVGVSDKTIDEDYDSFVENFIMIMADMNECGAGLSSVLTKQKELFTDASDLAYAIDKIYGVNLETEWPSGKCELQFRDHAKLYKDCMAELNTSVRTAAALTATEQAMTPLYAAVTEIAPEIEELCKVRNDAVKDFDSHRRRLKALELKKETAETQGKTNSNSYADNVSEIKRFAGKLQYSQEIYNEINSRTKQQISSARVVHDHLIDMLLITTITYQAELFARTAKSLATIVDKFPKDKVNAIKSQIQHYIKSGADYPVIDEKSMVEKGMAILTGKAVMKDFDTASEELDKNSVDFNKRNSDSVVEPSPPQPQPPSQKSTSNIPVSPSSVKIVLPTNTVNTGIKTGVTDVGPSVKSILEAAKNNANIVSSSRDVAGLKTSPPPTHVIALYDNEVTEDDELSFKAGDLIEVVQLVDEDWWSGRCHGKVGLFPRNYVKIET